MDWICIYHSEREAVFNLRAAEQEALILAQVEVGPSMIENAFNLALKKGWLVLVAEDQGESLITTRHTVLLEKLCIQAMRSGQGQVQPLLSPDSAAIQSIQADPRLTQGQKEAIVLLLTSSDRVNAVQGIAGAGKTTALTVLREQCLSLGFEPLVLAGTGNSKNQAAQVSGMRAMTTAQFLSQVPGLILRDPVKAQEDFGRHRLLILDEAAMASTRDLFQLQKVATTLGMSLDLTGDIKQQGSFGAGAVLGAFLGYGVGKAFMNENVRLKSHIAFEAMRRAYANDIPGTLTVLKDRIEEIPVKEEAMQRIVELYMDFVQKGLEAPLIVTPLNKDRRWVNEAIRDQLKEAGKLGSAAIESQVLLPSNRREIEKQHIRAFKMNDMIRFNTHNPRLGIRAGDYWQVIDIDQEHHRLSLQRFGERDPKAHIYWSPKDLDKPSSIEIYLINKREFVQQDCIVFKRNQPDKGIFNGDKATVVGVEGMQLSVRLVNGAVVRLDLREAASQHLDHGYALTIYQVQSRNVPFVIAYGEGPKALKRLRAHLKVGNWITLPKTAPDAAEVRNYSKVVRIMSLKGSILDLSDRAGNQYQEPLAAHQEWGYFPPARDRTAHDLPLSTSLQGFITTITRGDGLHLIVPNIADFQYTLEAHLDPKRSALSYLDPRWPTLKAGVQRLVGAIQWHYAPKVPETTKDQSARKQKQAASKSQRHTPQNALKSSIFSKNPFIDAEAVAQRLSADPLHYASQWLGPPSKVSGRDARWKGALTVTIRGAQAGRWRQWNGGGIGGRDLISLYSHAHNVE